MSPENNSRAPFNLNATPPPPGSWDQPGLQTARLWKGSRFGLLEDRAVGSASKESGRTSMARLFPRCPRFRRSPKAGRRSSTLLPCPWSPHPPPNIVILGAFPACQPSETEPKGQGGPGGCGPDHRAKPRNSP
jgi:hypothetical protein